MSLDGVIQGPGGADEDTSGGFRQGGWISGYGDEILGAFLKSKMQSSFDLLIGRKTFDIWAKYWPYHEEGWPEVNQAIKYIVSNTLTTSSWQPAEILKGDIVSRLKEIKQEQGPDLHVWGSSELIQTLTKEHLVDAFWLMIYPLTLGNGKRLFGEGTLVANFNLASLEITKTGIIIANYEKC